MGADPTRRARYVSSIAATIIALACGTNYVYSAWAPQFAERLKLSSTESNLIGLAGNFGMYSMGIPVGICVDSRGPRPAVLFGSILLAIGYFPLRQAYIKGEQSLWLLCFFSFCTGLGGCAAFAAAIKTSALNWPHHRGTATAFPLAAFGLSAFFFSVCGQVFTSGDPAVFLMLLACGCSAMTLTSLFFIRVLPSASYAALPTTAGGHQRPKKSSRRRVSEDNKRNDDSVNVVEPDMEADAVSGLVAGMDETDETSSLVSSDSFSDSGSGLLEGAHVDQDAHRLDIRGLKMLATADFWFLFSLMGLLTGVGLMTINNIGNDATALWRAYDPARSPEFVAKRQAMHVSILSVGSFAGRLCSGVGSDLISKKLHASRTWCLTISSILFLFAQFSGMMITNPNFLFIVSSLTGCGYGFLFGVFPSIVAEAFGVHGLSQNWGTLTIAPVISGNVFNLFYGLVYDSHSHIADEGHMVCDAGLECYRDAYVVTIVSCIMGILVTLWSIRHTHVRREKEARETERLA